MLMGVTTVVRAEEHLTNTVRQLLVFEALGFEKPRMHMRHSSSAVTNRN